MSRFTAHKRSIKGQTIMPEYIIAFFLVMTAMVAMTVYVQRALQARIHDARNYMINDAMAGINACGSDCQNASADTFANGQLVKEYEPYYGQTNSIVDHTTTERKGMTPQNTFKQFSETTMVNSTSAQLPPKEAN